jgi:hypothetical protein
MNPETPQIYGTIKLHKHNKPIRPIINWRNSPGNKLDTLLNIVLGNTIQLPYIYNVSNSVKFINNLKELNIKSDAKICSFDITNMYTNIPQQELRNIIYVMRYSIIIFIKTE